jgi:DNA-binding NtrC family response regulator
MRAIDPDLVAAFCEYAQARLKFLHALGRATSCHDPLAELSEWLANFAQSKPEAIEKLTPDLAAVLSDIRLSEDPGDCGGMEVLEAVVQNYPDIPIVMMTGYAEIDQAVEALKLGAADFVQKPSVDIREFRKVIHNAIERCRLKRKLAEVERDLKRIEPWEMVGDSPPIEKVRELIEIVAEDGFSTVLILGETGTGKELIARAIHSRGWRKEGPFVPVALPALPFDLIDSELFGHVKGAFTDARTARVGYIEKATGGVLFLDEIGDLRPETQVKLLRVLESKTLAPVGSSNEVTIDVQIVAATNCNLEKAIADGKFRADLFYRLRTVTIHAPPLRERRDDIPLLVDHFLYLLRRENRARVSGINTVALDRLKRHFFPGNIRELRSIIDLAVMFARNRRHEVIQADDLPLDFGGEDPSSLFDAGEFPNATFDLDRRLARIELSIINQALASSDGKKGEAWILLGLNDRFALRRRVKRILQAYPEMAKDAPLVEKLYLSNSV